MAFTPSQNNKDRRGNPLFDAFRTFKILCAGH